MRCVKNLLSKGALAFVMVLCAMSITAQAAVDYEGELKAKEQAVRDLYEQRVDAEKTEDALRATSPMVNPVLQLFLVEADENGRKLDLWDQPQPAESERDYAQELQVLTHLTILQGEIVSYANFMALYKEGWSLDGVPAGVHDQIAKTMGWLYQALVGMEDDENVDLSTLEPSLPTVEELKARVLYQWAENIGSWALKVGLDRPEVVDRMAEWNNILAELSGMDNGLACVYECGALRLQGRALAALPPPLGDIDQALRVLGVAFELTGGDIENDKVSRHELNTVYLVSALMDAGEFEDAEEIARIFLGTEPADINPDRVPEIQVAQALLRDMI